MNFDVSTNGMLIYVSGREDAPRTLVWVDRDGREESIAAELQAHEMARVSPDGTRALLDNWCASASTAERAHGVRSIVSLREVEIVSPTS